MSHSREAVLIVCRCQTTSGMGSWALCLHGAGYDLAFRPEYLLWPDTTEEK